jgi:adenosylcobinamide kinase / adenosylcobinamide-phosphate guanylyltransferase
VPDAASVPALPRTTLLLGGSRSGKSAVAERLLAPDSAVTYVATGRAPDGTDPDWTERVRRHRTRRPAGWTTRETDDLAGALQQTIGPVLVDSVGTWLTGVLDACGAWDDRPGWRTVCGARIDALEEAWRTASGPVVAVSDEVGSGVVPATASGRLFRDLLGELNARLSLAADRVLLVVAGRVLELAHPDDLLSRVPDVRPTAVEAP